MRKLSHPLRPASYRILYSLPGVGLDGQPCAYAFKDGTGAHQLGKVSRKWQDTQYVLGFFSARVRQARRAYERFLAEGVDQGRRPELVGGGLIRSAGGWSAIKTLRSSDRRVMGDERILGSGDFVQSVLKHAQEQYEKRTLARVKGLTLETLIEAVVKKLILVPADVRSAGRQRTVARARAIICALAIEYLGISGREVSRQLNLSASAVCKLAQRGRKDQLTEELSGALLGGRESNWRFRKANKLIFHFRPLNSNR